MPRFDADVPEIEWRDVTPPGSDFEVHGAPKGGGLVWRHRRRSKGIASEPRSNFMVGDAWKKGLPKGMKAPLQ